jgi:hypothetical protein
MRVRVYGFGGEERRGEKDRETELRDCVMVESKVCGESLRERVHSVFV